MELVFHTTSGALWSGPPSTYLNVVAVNMSMGGHWGKMTRHAACTLTEDLHRETGSTTTQKTRAIHGFYGNEWFEILWLVEKPQKISPWATWGSSALNIVQHGWTIYLKPQTSHVALIPQRLEQWVPDLPDPAVHTRQANHFWSTHSGRVGDFWTILDICPRNHGHDTESSRF